MRPSLWLRPPRLVLTLFLGITGVLSATMTLLAWQLMAQDRRLAGQRVAERLAGAADAAAGAMLRDLADFDERLAALAGTSRDAALDAAAGFASGLGDDAIVILSDATGTAVRPAGRLLYYPDDLLPPRSPGLAAPEFAAGERFEWQARDLAAALAAYGALERSPNRDVRATALARAARVAARIRGFEEALDLYGALGITSGDVEGLPAGLVAAYGRCLVLRDARRTDDLRREAAAFAARLDEGLWPLSRAEYDFYRGEVDGWMGATSPPAARLRLSRGLDVAWRELQTARAASQTGRGRQAVWVDGAPLLSTWIASSGRVVALLCGPDVIAHSPLGAARGALDRQRARLFLEDTDGRRWPDLPPAPGAGSVRRAASDTRLPWTLVVTDADPAADARDGARRRVLVIAGLGALGAFVVAGSGFIIRAVSRETAVARLQTDFVSAVSHEFRTPLASMRQLSELLADGRVASDEKRADYYRTLQRESARLHRLVEALLDFGRIESGAREYTLAPADFNTVVGEVVEEFAAGASRLGFAVEASYSDEVGTAAIDREAFGRALWNLLDNAVKYSPSCRTVCVATTSADGCARVSVRDRGVGVAADEQEAIFDKFRRGAGAAATRAKGTGLGLAMVRHIVAAHGGRVRVDSVVGEGSTFTIELRKRRGMKDGGREA